MSLLWIFLAFVCADIFFWFSLATDGRRAYRFTVWTIFIIFNVLNIALLKEKNIDTMIFLLITSVIIASIADRVGNYIIKIAKDIIDSNKA